MPAEKIARHGRMTAPAEKSDVGPECYILRQIAGRVGRFRVTDKTYRLAIDRSNAVLIVQHFMWIDRSVCFPRMTLKANLSPVLIGASAQQHLCPLFIESTVNLVTGETLDLAIVEGERVAAGIRRYNTNGMMFVLVVVAVKASIRYVELRSKYCSARLRLFYPMTRAAGIAEMPVCVDR